MGKMAKSLLIGIAAFVVVDAAAFDGQYLALVMRNAITFWYKLTHLDWAP